VLGNLINAEVGLPKMEKKDFYPFFCLHATKIIGLKIFPNVFACLQLNNENKIFILRQKNNGGTSAHYSRPLKLPPCVTLKF
jgi:hypothetical protein